MCVISFNIYGMKLKEVHFSSRTVITHFLDKTYQEIISEYLNMSPGKMSDFVSTPLFGFTLVIKLRNSDFESH